MAVAAFPSYPFKYDDVFAPVVAVAHKHKLYRDMFALCFHNNRTEDISRNIHPCKVCGKAVKVIQPAVEMVHLPVVLQHTDNIKTTAKYSFDERLIGEPCESTDNFKYLFPSLSKQAAGTGCHDGISTRQGTEKNIKNSLIQCSLSSALQLLSGLLSAK